MRISFATSLFLVIGSALLPGNVTVNAQELGAYDVSGTWTLDLVLPSGNVFNGTLTLNQEAGQINGTWQREGAGEELGVRGEIEGNAIAFFWIVGIPSRSDGADAGVKMSFVGSVEGDTMSGTASLGSRAEDLDWRAKRPD